MRKELEGALALAKSLDPAELPRLLGELAEISARAQARLMAPAVEARPDESLSVGETAKRMGVSESYLYHHRKKFKFARREGGRLLFSSSGLDNYLKRART
jgi:hypothetical protein